MAVKTSVVSRREKVPLKLQAMVAARTSAVPAALGEGLARDGLLRAMRLQRVTVEGVAEPPTSNCVASIRTVPTIVISEMR